MINEAANSCLALAELSRHGIFSFDIKSCRFVYCNPSFRKYVQVIDDLIPDSAINLLIHPDDEGYVRENYGSLLKSNKKRNLEFRLILPDKVSERSRLKLSTRLPATINGLLQVSWKISLLTKRIAIR